MKVPKPDKINNWVIWGDYTISVLGKFDPSVYDKEAEKYYIEMLHDPTERMRYQHQIIKKDEETYEPSEDKLKGRYPVHLISAIVPRDAGTVIKMNCNYKGEETEYENHEVKRLRQEIERLRGEIKSLNSRSLRDRVLLQKSSAHPQQFEKVILKRMKNISKGTVLVTGDGHLDPEEQ